MRPYSHKHAHGALSMQAVTDRVRVRFETRCFPCSAHLTCSSVVARAGCSKTSHELEIQRSTNVCSLLVQHVEYSRSCAVLRTGRQVCLLGEAHIAGACAAYMARSPPAALVLMASASEISLPGTRMSPALKSCCLADLLLVLQGATPPALLHLQQPATAVAIPRPAPCSST